MHLNKFNISSKQIGIVIAIVFSLLAFLEYRQISNNSDLWQQEKISKMYNRYSQEFPVIQDISAQQLKLLQQKEKVILIDVRTPREKTVSIIPGAISQTEFEQNINKYQDFTLVTYCTIGYRSGKYAEKWRKKGINILNLKEGILAWTYVQGELVNNLGQTNDVHVFGKQWKLVAKNYQPIW